MTHTDWAAWHDAYTESGSPLADRLAAVRALLVEQDAGLAARARALAETVGDAVIEVRRDDAARSDVYAGWVPADLVLLCGIFGNVSDADVRATVAATPQLCAPGAQVVWTRHRRDPDLTPAIRSGFESAGFEEVVFLSPGPDDWSVGVHRLVGAQRRVETSFRRRACGG